jgi:Flp pilus assembly protein TadD
MLMGSGAALSLVVGLVLVLRATGGATAVASVATPVTQTGPTTEALAPATPQAAPTETPTPPPAADSGKTGRVAKRRAGPARRKASVAHHGKGQPKREVRVAKAERKPPRTLAAKHAGPSAAAERGDPRPPYERGNALLFAGDAAGAIAAYREAVHDAPTDPIGYRGLGLAYEQKGETASAIRALHKYLKLAPGAADRTIISRRIDRLSKTAGAK